MQLVKQLKHALPLVLLACAAGSFAMPSSAATYLGAEECKAPAAMYLATSMTGQSEYGVVPLAYTDLMEQLELSAFTLQTGAVDNATPLIAAPETGAVLAVITFTFQVESDAGALQATAYDQTVPMDAAFATPASAAYDDSSPMPTVVMLTSQDGVLQVTMIGTAAEDQKQLDHASQPGAPAAVMAWDSDSSYGEQQTDRGILSSI